MLAVMLTLLGSAARPTVSAPEKRSTPAHIRAVEANLRPGAYEKGKAQPTWSLAERMQSLHVPGVSIAVIDNGRVEWAKGYGVKQAGGRDPVTPDTLFQAASISKPVTSLALLRQVDAHALTLDAPVNDTLKTWKVPDNAFTADERVTLRRLLTHSAGLTVDGFPGYAPGAPLPTTVQVLNGEPPAITPPVLVDAIPGSVWRYSGGGFLVAQLLLSDVTGKPFAATLSETVLQPLGMRHSTFQQPLPATLAGQAATAHDIAGNPIAGKWHVYPELAAAGLWTTPSDLGRFAIALQRAADGADQSLVSTATAQQMLTPGIGDWGLGIGVDGQPGQGASGRYFSHGGGNAGFVCMLFAYVTGGQGAVIMTNSEGGNQLIGEILRSLASVYGWGIMRSKEVTLAEVALSPYAGDYLDDDAAEPPYRVTIEGNRLHLTHPDIGDWSLSPLSETEFMYLDNGTTVTFSKDAAGAVESLSLWGQARRKRG
jgi:CubicO group peptidase (beta-lactamase class C family)